MPVACGPVGRVIKEGNWVGLLLNGEDYINLRAEGGKDDLVAASIDIYYKEDNIKEEVNFNSIVIYLKVSSFI